jgi:hypothetical protein
MRQGGRCETYKSLLEKLLVQLRSVVVLFVGYFKVRVALGEGCLLEQVEGC